MAEYCVLLSETGIAKERILSFLSTALTITEKEAQLRQKNAPGFILENCGFETAMKLHAQAEAAGIRTMVVEHPATLAQPLEIEKIELKNDGFYYRNKALRDFVRYDSLVMLAAAAISILLPPVKTAAELEEGLLRELRRKFIPDVLQPEGGRPREIIFYCDIFSRREEASLPAAAPGGTKGLFRLRFSQAEFDFSGLGAAKTYSSMENFRLLLAELEAGAFSKPFTNHAFNGIKQRTPVKDFILPSLQAYEKELMWLLCIGTCPNNLF